MNDVLLVWEMVPEETNLYWFEGMSDDDFRRVVGLHSVYANGVGNTEEQTRNLGWLDVVLEQKEPVWSSGGMAGTNAPFSVPGPCTVVVSGFIL